jgi:hypothetical protein
VIALRKMPSGGRAAIQDKTAGSGLRLISSEATFVSIR